MKERFAETELEGSKELKENAENKKTKKAENPVLEGKARFLREQAYSSIVR